MKKFYYEKKKEICLSDDEDDEPWEKFYTQTYFGKEKKNKTIITPHQICNLVKHFVDRFFFAI